MTFPKPQRQKECLDMSELAFGKTNRKQRIDKQTRKVKDRVICEIPGCRRPAQNAYHHVVQKSIVVIDNIFNFLRLCDSCHLKCDEGEISQVDQLQLVAERERLSLEQLINELSSISGQQIYIDEEHVKVKKTILQRVKHG